jgi:hypothetical protein
MGIECAVRKKKRKSCSTLGVRGGLDGGHKGDPEAM